MSKICTSKEVFDVVSWIWEEPVMCLDLLCRNQLSTYSMTNKHYFLFVFIVECNCYLWEILISELIFRPCDYAVTPIPSRI